MADVERGGATPADDVPWAVQVAAAWSWRLLVVAAAVGVAVALVAQLRLLGISLFVALLLTALLEPSVARLAGTRLGRSGATAVVLLGALLGLGLVAYGLAHAIAGQLGDLSAQFSAGLTEIREWLRDTFGIQDSQLQGWLDQVVQSIRDHRDALLSGALDTATVALEVLSGLAITAFSTVFFLADGRRIWAWTVSLFPASAEPGVVEAGARSWTVLTGYVRGTVIIALVDSVCIGLALGVLRVPLAVPLAVLVFFGAFVPIVGATVSGFVAVVVALAGRGPLVALLVLAAVVLVQQLEGHILQPVVMGRMVAVHPLGVVLAVTAGSLLAGLLGAVIAVPLTAVIATVAGYYRRRGGAPDDGAPDEAALSAAPPPAT